MKKYIWLVLGTGLAVALIFGIRAVTSSETASVSLVTLEPQTVRHTVVCSGKIEAADGQSVYTDTPCVVGTVMVQEGQYVKKGDTLFTVDAAATEQALSQLSPSLSGASGLVSENVTATATGVVTSLNVKAGDVVSHTKPCAVIASGGDVQIVVAVRERHLSQVKVGQTAEITGAAFPDAQYIGTVGKIAESAHQQYVGTVSETVVDAVIALSGGTDDERLKTGLNTKVSIVTGQQEGVLLIPYDCLAQNEKGEEYVYVYTGGEFARRRAVELGEEYAEGVLVVSGLSAGDRLVQNPEALSGEQVRVRVE